MSRQVSIARVTLFFGILALALATFPSLARAAEPMRAVYAIAIGHNAVAEALKHDSQNLVTLRYADDDATKVFSLVGPATKHAVLLSVLDADTQRRFPAAASRARPPTLVELERAVERVIAAMQRDLAAGTQPELLFFFSGHGVRDRHGEASLSLLDGALTRSWLYERLLARVPARYVHLVIDACHAAALVRPRDVDASVEILGESERQAYVDEATLERFPNVGVVLASSAGAQSFEWDTYRSGVFAHQLLSGLRGAADVNGDRLVEYSEIAAFLAAANLRVQDARARLDVVVRPPRLDRRVPLFDLTKLVAQRELRGRADGAWGRGFFVESASGERLLDAYPEQGAVLSLHLPTDEHLYVVRPDAEAELSPATKPIQFASLTPVVSGTRARGALDSALRQGLFAARFGPAFYQGYVSQRGELVAVPLTSEPEHATRPESSSRRGGVQRPLGVSLLAAAAASAITAGTLTVLTLDAKADYENTDLERPAAEASERFHRYRTGAFIAGGAALALGTAGGLLLLLPGGTEARAALLPDGSWALSARGAF